MRLASSSTRDTVGSPNATEKVREERRGDSRGEVWLDIVVKPDFSSWRWKDEDELQWVEVGRYARAEADALYAEGKMALHDPMQRREWFIRWRSCQPPETLGSAVLPEGWDAL